MAVDKLSLYNNSLLLIGQRSLSSLTEDREPRHLLDASYALDAIEYCLEVAKPVFARKTLLISSVTPSANHDLDSVQTLPSDYITVVGVYSDANLDQEVNRYIIEGNTLSCEYPTIYLRYISDDVVTDFSNWSPSFSRVVAAYLAREISIKLAPNQTEDMNVLLAERIEISKGLEATKEPAKRSSVTTNTLTNEWRLIYNDALIIMGLDEISTNTDDSNRRTKLDRVLDAGIVSDELEDTGWIFSTTSTKSYYDPSVEPAWGYRRAHQKPTDMHRIDGIFYDEYMQQPLKLYKDEGDWIFTDQDEYYLQYINDSFLVNPSSWPTYFKRLIAGRMANDASPSLKKEGADFNIANAIYEKRKSSAIANDAMQSPPRQLANGRWSSSRFKGGYRNRP